MSASHAEEAVGRLAELILGADGVSHVDFLEPLQEVLAPALFRLLALQFDVCPVHVCDVEICRDEDPAECRELRFEVGV